MRQGVAPTLPTRAHACYRSQMSGMPFRRARRATIAERCPTMPESAKPDDWFTRSLAQRLETVFGMGVDRAYDYLAWPPDKCDPHQLAAQKEAVRCMLMMGAKFAIDRANEAGRIETMRAVAAELG